MKLDICAGSAITLITRRNKMKKSKDQISRRTFCKEAAISGTTLFFIGPKVIGSTAKSLTAEDSTEEYYGMGIQIDKCIGCGRCVEACKLENKVPDEPYYYRTWVERFVITEDGEVIVDSPEGGRNGFEMIAEEHKILRTFFVPKLCNHCNNPPCVQVCPVGATFSTEDGVVLVDKDYCIGCRYCIQACPYGARYLNPETKTADKCTFCYHRLAKGLLPACVEVCPTGARIFGKMQMRSSPLNRFMRFNEIQVLKPDLNTDPKVLYANLDGEVR